MLKGELVEGAIDLVDKADSFNDIVEAVDKGDMGEALTSFADTTMSFVKDFAEDSGLDGLSGFAEGFNLGTDAVDFFEKVTDSNSTGSDLFKSGGDLAAGTAEAVATVATAGEASVVGVSGLMAEGGFAAAAAEFGAVGAGATVAAGVVGAGVAGYKVGEFLAENTQVDEIAGDGLFNLVGDEHALASVNSFENGEILEGLGHMAEGAGETIANGADNAVDAAVEAVGEAYHHVEEAVTETYHQVEEAVTETYHQVEEAVTETYHQVEEAVTDTYNHVEDAVGDAYDTVTDAATGAFDSASDAVGGAFDTVTSWF